MKRGIHLLLAVGLALSCIGCSGDTEKKKETTEPAETTSAVTPSDPTETPAATGEFTLVSLKVPNMY